MTAITTFVFPPSTGSPDSVIFAGRGKTDSYGYQRIELAGERTSQLVPISVVATPLQHGPMDECPRPAYLVVKIEHNAITVWSFATNGDWLPSVEFSWLYVAEHPTNTTQAL